MGAIKGITAALGASGTLVAAAVGLLVAMGGVIGLRWSEHATASDRPAASLQLHAARPSVPTAVRATPTAAPVALPRARAARATHAGRGATAHRRHDAATRAPRRSRPAPTAGTSPDTSAPVSTSGRAPSASAPATPAASSPTVALPHAPAVPALPSAPTLPATPQVNLPPPPGGVPETLGTTVRRTTGALGDTVGPTAGAVGLGQVGAAADQTVIAVGDLVGGLLQPTSRR